MTGMAVAGGLAARPPGGVRVLVVGATGYIGQAVVRELVRRGYDVRDAGRKSRPERKGRHATEWPLAP